MRRLLLLSAAFVLFLLALPLISAGSSGDSPALLWGGLVLLVGGSGLTLSVHFLHGDTCEPRTDP